MPFINGQLVCVQSFAMMNNAAADFNRPFKKMHVYQSATLSRALSQAEVWDSQDKMWFMPSGAYNSVGETYISLDEML